MTLVGSLLMDEGCWRGNVGRLHLVGRGLCLSRSWCKEGWFLKNSFSHGVNNETEECSSDHFVNSTLRFGCTSVPIVREALP